MVDIDRRRQQLMQAAAKFRSSAGSTALASSSSAPTTAYRQRNKVWTAVGSTFIKLPAEKVKWLIDTDRHTLDEETKKIRQEMKEMMLALQQFHPSELDSHLIQFALKS